MYFEIYHSGNLIKRGNEILNDDLQWENELMYVPTMSIQLPIEYLDYVDGHDEIKIFSNDKCFWGIVEGMEVDKVEEVLNIDLVHIVNEWTYRQISVNNAIKDGNINIIFKGSQVVSSDGKNISASPFNMLIDEVEDMTDEKYIKRAGASAWTDDGTKISITSVSSSQVKAVPGSYDVTFNVGSLSVTVKATVKVMDGSQKSTKNSVTIAAVPFEVSIDDVASLTDDDYIEKAFAIAWKDN